MLVEGLGAGLVVLRPVEIQGQWESLAATVSTMAQEASAAAADVEAAASAWSGLVGSYRESATEEIVRAAFDQVPGVTRAWAEVAGRACEVLQGFATEASGLQQRGQVLEAEARRLEALWWASDLFTGGGAGEDEGTSAEDDALRRRIGVHNSDVLALNSRWQQVETQTADELDRINGGGGLEEEIPVVTAEPGVFSGGAGASGFLGLSLDPQWLGFQAAVTRMLHQGTRDHQDDPVEKAGELYEDMMGEGATGEDVQEFRDHLAEMDESEIQEFSEETDAIHENSAPRPRSSEDYGSWPTGEDGHQWWQSLKDTGTQEAMMTYLPLLVGNVQGVPYTKRDTANRDALQRLKNNEDYNDWDENLTEIERSLEVESEEDMEGDDGESGDLPKMLLSLDIGQRDVPRNPGARGSSGPGGWDEQPLAAVSVGDPDTADTTTFGVSGMGSGTHDMQDEVAISERVHRDLDRRDDGSHAVVSWVGYDPPPELSPWDNPTAVLRNDRASTGGWDFAYALDGFQETRIAQGDDVGDFTVNVHAHSYGTNMSAYALSRTEYQVDTFAMYGSSGIPESVADHASDLHVATDTDGTPMIFASESNQDSTARWGRTAFVWGGERIDPTSEEFGAQEHYSGHQYDGDATNLADVTGHSREADQGDPHSYGYLDDDTTHYRNLTYILTGSHEEILSTEEYTQGSTADADTGGLSDFFGIGESSKERK